MNNSSKIQNLIEPWRILVFMGVLGLAFMIFMARLFYLQVLQTDSWAAEAIENSTKEFNIPAMRGIILDRNDVIVARNVASYNVVLTFANLPDDEGAIQEIFRDLSTLIGVPVNSRELSLENP